MTVPYWSDGTVTLHLGDCLDVLAGMEPASVDAVVTDPPYGIGFMGKPWDGDAIREAAQRDRDTRKSLGPASSSRPGRAEPRSSSAFGNEAIIAGPVRGGHDFQAWCEEWATGCLRVLKPGGHLLAFGGTRTWHRLACGIEDAGFEIRDCVADLTGREGPGLLWLYGSGFPKSLDVSKAIDKANGNPLAFRELARAYAAAVEASPLTHADIDRHLGIKSSSRYWAREDHRGGLPPRHHWNQVSVLLGLNGSLERLYDEAEREVIGRSDELLGRKSGIGNATQGHYTVGGTRAEAYDITAPATEDAARWSGWGTALKPAWEPIVVARKPLAGTVAGNVTEHGTGALNIDGCRVGYDPATLAEREEWFARYGGRDYAPNEIYGKGLGGPIASPHTAGRWPPNVLLGPEAAAELDRQSGNVKAGGSAHGAHARAGRASGQIGGGGTPSERVRDYESYGDSGGASRFFPVFRYEAKAPGSERPRGEDGTAHPTVKPVDLMAWLVRLVTPPGGLVADPFAGSGATAEACIVEGFRCVLIEKDRAYAALIRKRLRKDIQPAMFGS